MPVPASAHGENDARPLARDLEVGPYQVTVWQVIGDHASELSSHVSIDFGAEIPGPGEAVFVAGPSQAQHVVAIPSDADDGMWHTAEAVAFGDVIQVRVATAGSTWVSDTIAVPLPPGQTLLAKVVFALVMLVSALILLWLGRRTRRVWSPSPSAASVTVP